MLVNTTQTNTNNTSQANFSTPSIESEANIIKKNKFSLFQAIAILACCWLFYLYEYVLRVSTSVITNNLMTDFSISAGAVGTLIAFYYFAYVPLQIPCGVIVDRFGPRKVVTVSALLCVLGAILFASSYNLYLAQIGRFLIGAGSACAYISCMKIGTVWFKTSHFALIAGTSMMMGTLGGIFGGKPFAQLANNCGWRTGYLILALIGMAVMLIAWFVIKDSPKNTKHNSLELAETQSAVSQTASQTGSNVTQLKNQAPDNFLDGIKAIVAKKQNWLIGLYGSVMYLPLSAFAELWGVPYLMQRYTLSNEAASNGSLMVFLGIALGCLLSSPLSDYLKSRKRVLSLSANLTFGCFVLILYWPNLSLMALLSLLFACGVTSGISILYFACAKESNALAYSATTIGFTNALVMVSGLMFQPLLGLLLDYTRNGKLDAAGAPLYSVDDYQIAFSAVLIALLIGRILAIFIKDTYHQKIN